MSQTSTITERLLAHARFCRQIASASWDEETARKLELLAQDCVRTAKDALASTAGAAALNDPQLICARAGNRLI
jgi:hypothetical protein